MRLSKVINVASAIAECIGADGLVKLIGDPVKRQIGIDRLTDENLVPDPRKRVPE